MGKKKEGKKDAKKDKKPKEVDPATLPQPLKEAKGAFLHNEFILDVDEGRTVTHLRGGTSDAALGVSVFSAGRHGWRVVIDKTSNGSAYGIVIGVADATPNVRLTNMFGGAAWGIHTSSARFVSTLDCYERGYLGEPLMAAGLDGSIGLKNSALGVSVWIEVDMDQRSLSIGVDGGSVVRTPVRLPAAVRPWVLLSWEGDQVTMQPPEVLPPSTAANELFDF
mmetsp:Transcript_16224/g.49360  ORF Transcript_16224/g.49360 Transcript_16224/m.49360 type:complete len:222 (+) Transcript_16224:36-701(+)|eukprot:scaffold91357_cov36-Tisochrysis_lutea.AAC.3